MLIWLRLKNITLLKQCQQLLQLLIGGAIVHSRPLSLVVQPCLRGHLDKAMSIISDIFPPVAIASEFTKLSMLSYGSAIPLVYRPRLLLCGGEGTGLVIILDPLYIIKRCDYNY